MPALASITGPLTSTRARAARIIGVQRRCKPTQTMRLLASAAAAIFSASAEPTPGGFSMKRCAPEASTSTAMSAMSGGTRDGVDDFGSLPLQHLPEVAVAALDVVLVGGCGQPVVVQLAHRRQFDTSMGSIDRRIVRAGGPFRRRQ